MPASPDSFFCFSRFGECVVYYLNCRWNGNKCRSRWQARENIKVPFTINVQKEREAGVRAVPIIRESLEDDGATILIGDTQGSLVHDGSVVKAVVRREADKNLLGFNESSIEESVDAWRIVVEERNGKHVLCKVGI